MSLREYTSRRRWRLAGPVLEGGTVYALVLSPSADQHNPLVAGSPVGAFRSLSRGAQWSWANRGLTGLQISALAASPNGVLFIGSLDGTLARSVDGGYSWEVMPPLEDSGSITSLAVSPDYLRDGTVLVGTETGGVFRTTDSGRTARPANFGLLDPTVLALVCAPGWPDRPVAFAATIDGVFRSTNGGRAWRPSGEDLDGLSVQALAVSPAFTRDGTVFAGSEEDGLFRSTDGGDSWQPLGEGVLDSTINALWVAPDFRTTRLVLAGTAGGGVYRSADAGDTWSAVLSPGGAVLALTGDGQTVFAGFHGSGVHRSSDGGQTWEECREGLYAHAFTYLSAANNGALFVAGPDTGIFTSSNGSDWKALPALPDLSALAAMTVWPDYHRKPLLAVADAEDGLYLSGDGGATWNRTLDGQVSALASAADGAGGGYLWAGTAGGALHVSTDGGSHWTESEPFAAMSVLKIEPSGQFPIDRALLAATRDVSSSDSPLVLWRSSDAGQSWTRIIEESSSLMHVGLLMRPGDGGRPAGVFDRYCLIQQGADQWKKLSLGVSGNPPLLALAARQGLGEEIVVVGSAVGVFATDNSDRWTPMMRGMGSAPVLALTPANGDREQPIWALALGGIIWSWESAG